MSAKHNYTASDVNEAVNRKLYGVIATLTCVLASEDNDMGHGDAAQRSVVLHGQIEKLQELYNDLDSMAVHSEPTSNAPDETAEQTGATS